jgi:hypothetical protein
MRQLPRRAVLIAAVLILTISAATGQPATSIPSFGYSTGARGYDLPGITPAEHAAADIIWRPAGSRLTLHLGTAVPLADGWLTESLFSAGADAALFRLRAHPFRNWITLESQYAPGAGIGILAAGLLGGSDAEGTAAAVYLSAALQPLKFEVGGGYFSFLAPSVYWDIPLLSADGTDLLQNEQQNLQQNGLLPSGWGMTLFDFGFYLW